MPSFPKPKYVDHCERKATHDRKAKAFRDAVWRRERRKDIIVEWAPCARCHVGCQRGVSGEVDHIKPRSTHPELKYDPTNGRIVCHDCNRFYKTHPLEREP